MKTPTPQVLPETAGELEFVQNVLRGTEAFIADMLTTAQDQPPGYAQGFTDGTRTAVAAFIGAVLAAHRAAEAAPLPTPMPHRTVH